MQRPIDLNNMPRPIDLFRQAMGEEAFDNMSAEERRQMAAAMMTELSVGQQMQANRNAVFDDVPFFGPSEEMQRKMESTMANIKLDGKVENGKLLPIREDSQWIIEVVNPDNEVRVVNIHLVNKNADNYGSGAPNHLAANYDEKKALTSMAVSLNIMTTTVLIHKMTAIEQVVKTILCRCDEQYDAKKYHPLVNKLKMSAFQPHRPSTILFDSKTSPEGKAAIAHVCKSLGIPNARVAEKHLSMSVKLNTEMSTTLQTLMQGGMGWWENMDLSDSSSPREWFYGTPEPLPGTPLRLTQLCGWRTTLENAVRSSDCETADMLLNIFKHYAVEFIEQRTLTARYVAKAGDINMMRVLIKHGCSVNGARGNRNKRSWRQCQYEAGDRGDTPLGQAAHNGHGDLVAWLLTVGCASLSVDTKPLFVAIANNHRHCAEILINKGVDTNQTGIQGESPLQLCQMVSRGGSDYIQDFLIANEPRNKNLKICSNCKKCKLLKKGNSGFISMCPCRAKFYCCTECQKADWGNHKKMHKLLMKDKKGEFKNMRKDGYLFPPS